MTEKNVERIETNTQTQSHFGLQSNKKKAIFYRLFGLHASLGA